MVASALDEFGLRTAFEARSPAEQARLAEWVRSAASAALRVERVAELLDDLAAQRESLTGGLR